MKLILCLLILSFPLDEKKKIKVVCPLDGHTFTATQIIRTNDWGGVDLDFCRHAYKTQPMNFYVWVCPNCAFAGKKNDFSATLSDQAKQALLGKLIPQTKITRKMKQTDIAAHVKYDLLAQVKTLTNGSPLDIGRAYLGAAWTFREEGAIYLDNFDEWERVWKMYHLDRLPLELGKKNRTDYDLAIARKLEKRLEETKYKALDRMLREYLVAYLYRKHGELLPSEKWIAKLKKSRGENSVLDNAIEKMERSIEREKEFLKKAQLHLAKVHSSKEIAKETKGDVAYVEGEIHRRLGAFQKASDAYDLAIKTSPSKALQDLATRQKDSLPR
jgi:uncharacterized protein (DUF2225 family)